MADTLYLEKMGRELKCPICLSLLNSAASLTCNHVFCNFMYSKIDEIRFQLPQCAKCRINVEDGMKVSHLIKEQTILMKENFIMFEIRPAPHMDNLVNIYKSMEVASGVRLYVTQNEPTTKLTDAECRLMMSWMLPQRMVENIKSL
ncbi:Protein BREAST CANCER SUSCEPTIBILITY 1-like protein [Bienertia sinuspersici]